MPKLRLDQLLVERGLAESRSQAQAMVMAGEVRSNDTVLLKSGQSVEDDVQLQVTQKPRYVSRAGDKLASVAAPLHLDFVGRVVLDAGSSTGGFTDFVLQNGAAKVYAVDVGSAQLAYRLRQDDRVEVMERTDIRQLQPDRLDPRPDMAVADLSFISLTKVLPAIATLVQPGGQIIAMAKPQFETDKPTADRFGGVITDEAVRRQILTKFEQAIKPAFQILDSADSQVVGTKGNRERFYLLIKR